MRHSNLLLTLVLRKCSNKFECLIEFDRYKNYNLFVKNTVLVNISTILQLVVKFLLSLKKKTSKCETSKIIKNKFKISLVG